MPAPADFENSASFLQSVGESVKEIGCWEKLERAVDPKVFAALKSSREHRWWPGALLIELTVALDRVAGAAAVEQVGFLATKKGIAPIAMRLVRVTFALAGPSPDTIFARASLFGPTAVRGLDMQWKRETPTSGMFLVTYPKPVPPPVASMWKGTLKFVFELTDVEGTAGPVARGGGPTVAVPLAWKPR